MIQRNNVGPFSALCVALCIIAAPRPVHAQQSVAPRLDATVTALKAAEYTLGAEDVIEVTVQNHNDLNTQLTVLTDGSITVPPIGKLKAAGKTPDALAAEIQTGLEKTYNNCPVLVSVKEIHSRRVRILGAIKGATIFDLKPGMRLMDLIAASGGLTAPPELIKGRLVRVSSSGAAVQLSLNIPKAFAEPESDINLPLQVDDLVLLDIRQGQVYVEGQVSRPGAFDIGNAPSVLSILSQAGGPTTSAALKGAYILRNGKQIPVDLHAILVDGKDEGKVLSTTLQSGDTLFIPEVAHYAVNGDVIRPGTYPLPEAAPRTVGQALNEAGGPSPTANISEVGIIRNVQGKVVLIKVNLTKLYQKGDLTGDIVLKANDIVYVPAKGSRGFSWQDLFGPVTLLNFLFHL